MKRGASACSLIAVTILVRQLQLAVRQLPVRRLHSGGKQQHARHGGGVHQSGTVTDALGSTLTFDGPGKIPGYAILNLNAEAKLGDGWQMFAKVNNVFDKHYATAGALAENPFVGGSFQADPGNWYRETFIAPGTPRSAWLGVRYVFGGK
ncbi:MAG: hypothetical protein CVU31_00320 [Betaproteobacteria bacterium HGW-Betaproteobacteria-4]|jgi:outer membrane receptor protein involved in Fe transport|nr:MAG: hypothetical protein CVU31_00320 [Betaproteobacteria bacterium HGW-Betaproteobacteria-4]